MDRNDDLLRKSGVTTKQVEKTIKEEVKKKEERIKKFRQEASRLSSMANKRLQRLEKAGLQDSPAYKKWLDEGGQKFGIRGKDYNEVQKEVARMRNFINSETSTIRGVNSVLKEMANNTGIKYKNLKELRQSSKHFFELASKVEQYLRTVEDMASAIGYQKIWEAINKYVQSEKIDLSASENNIEEMTHKVIQALNQYTKTEKVDITENGFTVTGWYQLEKD